jgi:hypothetical protein
MSISGKGASHGDAKAIHNKEIETLSTTSIIMYHGVMKQMARVKVCKILTCVDQPERTSIFQVGDHNGTFSANWGFAGSMDCTLNNTYLPSCKQCCYKIFK